MAKPVVSGKGAMPAKAASKADKLAMLREKLKNTDMGGSGAGWFTPKEGKNSIRILPEVGNMSGFFQTVGTHQFPGRKDKIYCPAFTSDGELECPVCDLVSQLYKAGDKASKDLAIYLGKRRNYWMNVIDRNNESAGPLIYTPGVQVFSFIAGIIADEDFGDITDIYDGFDLTIDRKGKGLDTEYDVRPRRNPSALHADDDQVQQWLDAAKDLSWVEVSESPEDDKELSAGHAVYLFPYNRIVTDLGLDDIDVEAAAEKAVAEKNGGPTPAAIAKPKRQQPVVEEEDNVVDEEDEVPAKRPAPATTERTARRSMRR